MTVWKYANLALLAAVYICDPWQHKRIAQVRFLMMPITGHTRISPEFYKLRDWISAPLRCKETYTTQIILILKWWSTILYQFPHRFFEIQSVLCRDPSPLLAAAPAIVLQCCLAFKTFCDVINKGCLWRHKRGWHWRLSVTSQMGLAVDVVCGRIRLDVTGSLKISHAHLRSSIAVTYRSAPSRMRIRESSPDTRLTVWRTLVENIRLATF